MTHETNLTTTVALARRALTDIHPLGAEEQTHLEHLLDQLAPTDYPTVWALIHAHAPHHSDGHA